MRFQLPRKGIRPTVEDGRVKTHPADASWPPSWIAEERIKLAATRERFGPFFDEAVALFFRVDPIGLSSAPKDEYEPEVGTTLARIAEANTESDLRLILGEEFVRWFGYREVVRDSAPKRLDALATELWAMWLQRKQADV